jgi:hypothetical protein
MLRARADTNVPNLHALASAVQLVLHCTNCSCTALLLCCAVLRGRDCCPQACPSMLRNGFMWPLRPVFAFSLLHHCCETACRGVRLCDGVA